MEMTPDAIALGLIWFVAFLFSTTVHEAAHALVAMKLGDPTAYHGGQVSLNPVPHVRRSPFGMVVVPLISYAMNGWMFGWASAPYDPEWADRHPRRAGWMALAGPLSNLALAILAGLLIRLGLGLGWFEAPRVINDLSVLTVAVEPGAMEGLATLLSATCALNFILFAFNLLPFPPLDGSAVVQLILPEQVSRKYREFLRQPMLALAGIVLAWKIFGEVFWPVFGLLIDALYPGLYR